MATVKCKSCGKQIDKKDAILVKPRCYVCSPECKAKLEQPAPKLPPDENKARQALLDYIDQHASQDVNWPMLAAQLKRMLMQYPKFTYGGIHYTLWYTTEMLDIPLNGIGLVPYYYDEARAYYQWQQSMRAVISSWKYNDQEQTISRQIDKPEIIFD